MKLTKIHIAIIIVVIIAIIIAIVWYRKKQQQKEETGGMSTTDYDKYFKELVAFVKKAEGGLSNDMADSASSNPSPTPQKYHTNIGVTWTTFVNSAKELGYTPSVENFLTMPEDIWMKIFEKKYRSKTEKISKNPVLRNYIALWFWGGWYQGHITPEQVTAIINSDKSDKQKLRDLVELRKLYFDKVIAAIPTNKKYEKGWKQRAEDYYTLFNKYLA